MRSGKANTAWQRHPGCAERGGGHHGPHSPQFQTVPPRSAHASSVGHAVQRNSRGWGGGLVSGLRVKMRPNTLVGRASAEAACCSSHYDPPNNADKDSAFHVLGAVTGVRPRRLQHRLPKATRPCEFAWRRRGWECTSSPTCTHTNPVRQRAVRTVRHTSHSRRQKAPNMNCTWGGRCARIRGWVRHAGSGPPRQTRRCGEVGEFACRKGAPPHRVCALSPCLACM